MNRKVNVFFKPFSTNVPLLYPVKTSKNLRFFYVLRGYRGGTLVENGLNKDTIYFLLVCKTNLNYIFLVLLHSSVPTKNVYEDITFYLL